MQEGEKDIQKELTGVERRKEVLTNLVGEVNKPVLITGEEGLVYCVLTGVIDVLLYMYCKARQQQSQLLAYASMCNPFTTCPEPLPGFQTWHPPKSFGTCTHIIIVTSLLTTHPRTHFINHACVHIITLWQSRRTALMLKIKARHHLH